MLPGEDDVGALAGERQLVLHEHLDVAEPGVDEVGAQPGEAALPRATLGGGGRPAGGDGHLLRDVLGELRLGDGQSLHGRSEQEHRQDSPGSTKLVRVGACPERKPVGPL
ncbi:hypothetical protein [Ornithinimicrobium panacihumi]|uniref:hypothetical protein n=1 Tax=Ornithinimicrobium panacihumi TaxID=2008449 RepID=UPI003F8AA89F